MTLSAAKAIAFCLSQNPVAFKDAQAKDYAIKARGFKEYMTGVDPVC